MNLKHEDLQEMYDNKESIYIGAIRTSFTNWDIEDGFASLELNSNSTFNLMDIDLNHRYNTLEQCIEHEESFYESDGKIDDVSIEIDIINYSKFNANTLENKLMQILFSKSGDRYEQTLKLIDDYYDSFQL